MEEPTKCLQCGARIDVKPLDDGRIVAECSFCTWKATRDEEGAWRVFP